MGKVAKAKKKITDERKVGERVRVDKHNGTKFAGRIGKIVRVSHRPHRLGAFVQYEVQVRGLGHATFSAAILRDAPALKAKKKAVRPAKFKKGQRVVVIGHSTAKGRIGKIEDVTRVDASIGFKIGYTVRFVGGGNVVLPGGDLRAAPKVVKKPKINKAIKRAARIYKEGDRVTIRVHCPSRFARKTGKIVNVLHGNSTNGWVTAYEVRVKGVGSSMFSVRDFYLARKKAKKPNADHAAKFKVGDEVKTHTDPPRFGVVEKVIESELLLEGSPLYVVRFPSGRAAPLYEKEMGHCRGAPFLKPAACLPEFKGGDRVQVKGGRLSAYEGMIGVITGRLREKYCVKFRRLSAGGQGHVAIGASFAAEELVAVDAEFSPPKSLRRFAVRRLAVGDSVKVDPYYVSKFAGLTGVVAQDMTDVPIGRSGEEKYRVKFPAALRGGVKEGEEATLLAKVLTKVQPVRMKHIALQLGDTVCVQHSALFGVFRGEIGEVIDVLRNADDKTAYSYAVKFRELGGAKSLFFRKELLLKARRAFVVEGKTEVRETTAEEWLEKYETEKGLDVRVATRHAAMRIIRKFLDESETTKAAIDDIKRR